MVTQASSIRAAIAQAPRSPIGRTAAGRLRFPAVRLPALRLAYSAPAGWSAGLGVLMVWWALDAAAQQAAMEWIVIIGASGTAYAAMALGLVVRPVSNPRPLYLRAALYGALALSAAFLVLGVLVLGDAVVLHPSTDCAIWGAIMIGVFGGASRSLVAAI